MWIELDETEVAVVLAAVDDPSIVEKLTPKPRHPYAEHFIDATNCYSHDNPIDDAPIMLDKDGAYVLTWVWVYNSDAGVPNPFDHLDVSQQCRELLEEMQSVDIEDWQPRKKNFEIGSCDFDDYRLSLVLDFPTLAVHIKGDHGPIWSYYEPSSTSFYDTSLEDPAEGRCLRFLLAAIDAFRNRSDP